MFIQRLANHFPDYSKIRQDQSSFGYRFLSVFGEYLDWAHADSKKLLQESRLLRSGLGRGHVYQIVLDEDSQMPNVMAPGGLLVWTYPTLVGTTDSIAYDLDRVDSVDELFWDPPTRLDLIDTVGVDAVTAYSDDRAGTVANNDIDYPSYLLAKVTSSTDYFAKTLTRNARSSGQHLLLISGKDQNGTDVTERIQVRDDGNYWTKNVWTSITEVIPEGFDGAFTLSHADLAADYIVEDPFKVCILEDDEGPLKLRADTYVESATYTSLTYYTDIIKQGSAYRDGVDEIVPNTEERWVQTLLDSDGAAIEVVHMAINPNSTRLYCLDTDARIHVYDHEPTIFVAPTLAESITVTSYLDLIPVQSYAMLGETIKLFTRFVRVVFPVLGVTIKRVDPAGVVNYLQADKTWAVGAYEFRGQTVTAGLPEDSWQDFQFDTEFDQFGQWEFYCTLRTKFDSTMSYVGVLCDGLSALVSLDTGKTNPLAIFFNDNDDLVLVSDDTGPAGENYTYYVYQEYGDRYWADVSNQILYLRETYDSVEVT